MLSETLENREGEVKGKRVYAVQRAWGGEEGEFPLRLH